MFSEDIEILMTLLQNVSKSWLVVVVVMVMVMAVLMVVLLVVVFLLVV